MTPNYTRLWKLLDIIIYEEFYLGIEGELYSHSCMTNLLSMDDLTEDTIAYVYNRETV